MSTVQQMYVRRRWSRSYEHTYNFNYFLNGVFLLAVYSQIFTNIKRSTLALHNSTLMYSSVDLSPVKQIMALSWMLKERKT